MNQCRKSIWQTSIFIHDLKAQKNRNSLNITTSMYKNCSYHCTWQNSLPTNVLHIKTKMMYHCTHIRTNKTKLQYPMLWRMHRNWIFFTSLVGIYSLLGKQSLLFHGQNRTELLPASMCANTNLLGKFCIIKTSAVLMIFIWIYLSK